MIERAPSYRGEGPHALWHVSEDDSIARFEPHHRPEHALDEPLVGAVDTRHLPLPVEPLGMDELGDLVARHGRAGIELRTDRELLRLWDRVVASTLDFGGIRLRNARMSA